MNMKKTVFFIVKIKPSFFPEEATGWSGSKLIAEAGTIKSASFMQSRLKSIATLIDNRPFYVIKFYHIKYVKAR